MRACLLLINILFSVIIAKAIPSYHSFLPVNYGEKKEYISVIQFKSNTLTGICIVKNEQEKYNGTFINEFGIKGFDFTYDSTKNKIVIINLVKFLDKWYIKNTLKKDLKFLFNNKSNYKKKKREVIYSDSCIVLKNNKLGLIYNFKPILK